MNLDLVEIREKLYAGAIADILDDLGYRDQVMDATIRPVQPDVVLVGTARTMLAIPEFSIPAQPYELQIDATDALRAGDVVVAHLSGITSSAFWGELFSTAALARGAAGAVMDGYVRDVRRVAELGFPLFAAGMRPVNSRGRCTVAAYDVPVRCGGVLVHPGDLIFGEIDGVVVVPQALIDRVVTQALHVAGQENRMRAELARGSTLRAAWEKYRVL
jgi:4-hydroxy-4-methyl-2-oxoglutarate aldolase